MAKKKLQDVRFDDKLVLFRFCLKELGITDWKRLRDTLNRPEEEGINPSTGNTRFLDHLIHQPGGHVAPDRLRLYDENIMKHTRQIGQNRGGLTWKYFQYLSLLFTEMYLDRYFNDRDELCADLNAFMQHLYDESMGMVAFKEPFNVGRMNKLAFMCATGSGKTLLLHVNLLQYLHYMRRAQRADSRININKVILLTPNEGMSRQHKEELDLSGIKAEIFQKDGEQEKGEVCIIDINKLEEEGKDKTVSVDSFERNNLLLVDEGHRGLASGGKVWLDYRKRLAEDGFTFEYSATFKQALNVNATSAAERDLAEDYCKAIIMDYSYKYFYEDGYGKDYRIFNLTTDDSELRLLYLTGCLLSFYQQKKCFREYKTQIAPFNIEDPLMVFVGNRVTTKTSKEDLTDVEDVVMFFDQFVRNKQQSVRRIGLVLTQRTGLLNEKGDDLFTHDFTPLADMMGGVLDAQKIFEDVLFLVFNTTTMADEPRLHMEHLRGQGEIALKVGDDGDYFGVISVGDTTKLMKICEEKQIVVKNDPIFNTSLFAEINRRNAKYHINVLIGSRKFTEGWNSWRVSTIGLINFAKGEGSQAIQMFGRGVRLKGFMGLLKRSHALSSSLNAPQVKHIGKLETLTLFGVKANYMVEFKKFLEMEGTPSNDNITEVNLPVVSRYEKAKGKRLRIIRVRADKNFKRDARRMMLGLPDEKFKAYLVKNKVSIDCRSKVQTIDVTDPMKLGAELPVNTMPNKHIAVLDYQYLYDELQEYKNEKSYFNLSIEKDSLQRILEDKEWYEFIIPRQHLEIDSMQKLQNMNEFCLMALKAYVEKFYRFEKERWEDQYLEYAELEATDNNFVDEYSMTLTEEAGGDYGKELEKFIADATAILNSQHALDSYDSWQTLAGNMVLFDFRYHLYAPLVCVKKSNLKIQVSPVSMNADEKQFVDYLEQYVNTHADWLTDKSLFLLRNKSKVGMGFFEAGNFYPDYILWIDTPDVQYISFIDPKGLLHFTAQDEKIKFYKKIKELEERLAASAKDKRIVLNSFIMSATKAAQLKQWWHMTMEEYEAMNVYTLDDSRCVEKMIEKIWL